MKRQPVNNDLHRVCPECGELRATNKALLFDSNDLNAPCLICKFKDGRQQPVEHSDVILRGNGRKTFLRDIHTFRTPREPKRDLD